MKVLKFIDFVVENIYGTPDFNDAYILDAVAVLEDGTTRQATDEELDELNKDSELVFECVMERLY